MTISTIPQKSVIYIHQELYENPQKNKLEGELKMKKPIKMISFLLVLILTVGLFSGCTGTSSDKTGDTTTKVEKDSTDKNDEKPAESETKEGESEAGSFALPIVDKPITFTYWVPFGGTAKEIIPDLSQNEVYQELEKLTNVKIEFIHPPEGQETEHFNLMISSGDLPDIIEQGERYKGGIDKAIADGIYIRLNELVDKYAPNFKKIIESNEELKKQVYSDEGNLLGFGMITSDVPGTSLEPTAENPWCGPFIRKDWLDELGMEIPTTIDEWYTALKAFKEQMNAEVPMIWNNAIGMEPSTGAFVSAFDIGPGFYIKNGEIKYGPIEPGFKEYLQLVNKWYEEGLIDRDFPTRDAKSIDALVMSGKVGAKLQDGTALVLKARAVGIEFAGAPYPKKNENSEIHWRYKNNICRANYGVITSKCKNPEVAVKWFDYHYTEDGFKLFNFGVEGKSYTGIDEKGRPKYVEYISKNNYQDFDRYNSVFRLHNGPYLKSDLRSNPRRWMEDLEQYRITWNNQPADYVLPPITLTAEEGAEYAKIMSDIEAYRNEMMLKFIMGQEPLDKFDEYVNNIKAMNIDRVIEIYKAALDRYNKRLEKVD